MARATKLGDLELWHKHLKQLKEERFCPSPGFLMPYHFVTMALLLKQEGAGHVALPDEITEYAARLKLWEAIGLQSPVVVPSEPRGSRYHELTPMESLGDVDNVASNLARMLTSNASACSQESGENIFIMLVELLGNCYHHARASDGLHGLACAQTWYRDSRAQFAIADSGIGIRESLAESADLAKRLRQNNACDLASQYGISSKLGKGHAGYGLTLARDLAERTPGSMLFVQSCSEAIFIENRRLKVIDKFDHAITGTLVVFEWDMGRALDLESVYRSWPNPEADDNEFFS